MNILQLIASDSFITVNKDLIKLVGLEEAILIGELASEYDYWQKNNGLTEDGYFFSTQENIEDKTTLSPYQQRKAFNKLKELNLVEVSVRGLPAKRYIKIIEKSIIELFENKLSKNLISSCEKTEQLEVKKLNGNNNINNNNITNNNINISNSKELEAEASSTKESSEKTKGKKSLKEQLVDYVNSLGYEKETKEVLFKWIFSIGLNRKVKLEQLQDMLKNIWESCNDESLVRESINKSYLNNWFGFYPPKTTSTPTPPQTPVKQTSAPRTKPRIHPTEVF